MLVSPDDLRELNDPSGARFQRFVTALVTKEALSCGLKLTDIDADYRTNYPDGGCDIFVSKGSDGSSVTLIPNKPSIWSVKAGSNGINPGKLAEEIRSHTRVVKHLKGGNIYVWCGLAPAGQEIRQTMRSKAADLAGELDFASELIQFVWDDHLCGALNRYPNLIADHLPNLHSIIRPMMTLMQWKEESPDKKGLKVPFVPLPGTTELQNRIESHLLGNTGDSVLHVAGLSGIGKTRTTIEACATNDDLKDVLYVGAFSQIGQNLWRRLTEPGTHIRLIIDEVPLAEVTRLQGRFDGLGDRIRILSIGPAPRAQARRQRDPALTLLEPPDETTGVLPVVRASAPEMDASVQRSIAHFSGHDLRLALLLVEATRKTGALNASPLRDYEEVWGRIMSLFSSKIPDPSNFRSMYELLTLSIDVGYADEYRGELVLLAQFFGKSETELDRAIRDANDCGLGEKLQNFFEAKPAALAVWLFQESLWPVLKPRLQAFAQAKPSARLLRRFLQRCQETASPYREEVSSEVARFFLNLLGKPNLQVLADREPSRLYQTWAEFDPVAGLDWLERAVKNASDDDLRTLRGDADGSGGWRGRRQIVWLCEHLACFAEHFDASERILFRLAQVETETRIGNNSTNTWREMFLPVLANTEVPFPTRLELLKQRLASATTDTIGLVLSAFYGSIARHIVRGAPPGIVGGRIVPDQWEPRTVQELEQYRLDAAKTVLEMIPKLSPEVGRCAANSVILKMAEFLAYGLVGELRAMTAPYLGDESLKRQLLLQLEDWLSRQEKHETEESRPPWFDAARDWRNELSPTTLRERIKELTARDYWSVHRINRLRSEAEPAQVYSEIAKEILQCPAILRDMATWLTCADAVSATSLLFQIGANDTTSTVLPIALDWFSEKSGTNLVASYLAGVHKRAEQLPDIAIQAIDDAANSRPADAVHITLLADPSENGLRRLLRVVPILPEQDRGMLRQLAFQPWQDLLDVYHRGILLEQFCQWADAGDRRAVGMAMGIIAMWRHQTTSILPAALGPIFIRLIKSSAIAGSEVDDNDWKEAMETLASMSPRAAAELLADEMTAFESQRFRRRQNAEGVFHTLSRDHPEIAMQAIEKWLLDQHRRPIFRLHVFRGLFDAIGLDTVKPWVEQHGEIAAVGIARHLDGPKLEKGAPYIPKLADWLLSTYEHVPDVFSEFAMGRHSGEARWGYARDREAELNNFLSYFAAIPKNWVQKWIKYEQCYHQRDVEWQDRLEEENGRI